MAEASVRLAAAGSLDEAHRWQQALAVEGIAGRLIGDPLGGFSYLPAGNSSPELWVEREDFPRARAILAACFRPGQRRTHGPPEPGSVR
jgi:hypothetical protein